MLRIRLLPVLHKQSWFQNLGLKVPNQTGLGRYKNQFTFLDVSQNNFFSKSTDQNWPYLLIFAFLICVGRLCDSCIMNQIMEMKSFQNNPTKGGVLGKYFSVVISVISTDSAMPLQVVLMELHLWSQRKWLTRSVSAAGMPYAGVSLAAHSCPLPTIHTSSKIQPTNSILNIFQLKIK